MHLSAPGNLLLLGEYAVLEEGGLGVAVAAVPRVVVSVRPGPGLVVTGSWPGGGFTWTREEPFASPLVSAIVQAVESRLGRSPGGAYHVDSSGFFDAAGRKAGLGSSAAVAAALTAALLGRGTAGAGAPAPAAAQAAVEAHRAAQGGRGSGYDVLCSWHGGAGLFAGGVTPSWRPAALAPGVRIGLFPGPAAVRTADAVARYQEWKQKDPVAARSHLSASNACASAFAAGGSRIAPAWRRARDLGIRLGDAIGVEARVTPPPGVDPELCKALGAGNELGACLLPPGAEPPAGLTLVVPAPGGVTWEE